MKYQPTSHYAAGPAKRLFLTRLLAALVLTAFSLAFSQTALAQPTFPLLYAGTVKVVSGGALVDAPVGTVVSAKVKGVDLGRVTVTEAGKYGAPPFSYLLVQGAMAPGDTIEFYINGVKALQTDTYTPGAEPHTSFNLFPVGAPTPTPTSTRTAAPTATPTPTPARTPTVQPTATSQPSPTATPPPSITPKLTPTPSPTTPTPTPTQTPSTGLPIWVPIGGGVLVGIIVILVSMLAMRRRRNI